MGEDQANTELLLSLARIEGKLDVIDARLESLAKTDTDHEGRLRELEKRPAGITPRVFLSSMVGIATIVGSIGTVVTLAVSK